MMASATKISIKVKPRSRDIVGAAHLQLAAAAAGETVTAADAGLVHAELERRHLAARQQKAARRHLALAFLHAGGGRRRGEGELFAFELEVDHYVERQGARPQDVVVGKGLPLFAVEHHEGIAIGLEFQREHATLQHGLLAAELDQRGEALRLIYN